MRTNENRHHCLDCGINNWDDPTNWYMVKSKIWKKYVTEDNIIDPNNKCPIPDEPRTMNGQLCINCLEKRMGRSLTYWDFKRVPANYINPTYINLKNKTIKLVKDCFRHPIHTHNIILSCSNQRLLEHGFTPGTEIILIDLKFFGKIFKVRGSMIGIRNQDMRSLTLKEKDEP